MGAPVLFVFHINIEKFQNSKLGQSPFAFRFDPKYLFFCVLMKTTKSDMLSHQRNIQKMFRTLEFG